MPNQYFSQQFPDLRRDKLRRRRRFTKHYEVKMRLKRVWYRAPKPRPGH